MATSDADVLIIGGGGAGIAAGRRLAHAGIACVILEARPRLGGRAWTREFRGTGPIDLGCGWLHSGDRNPWRAIAEAQGRAIDRTPPPWGRPSNPVGFPLVEQAAFREALQAFHARLDHAAETGTDRAAAAELERGGRWNGLIGAVTTYLSGAEPERISLQDFASYADSGVNWRVAEGLGATVAAHAADLPVVLDCPVQNVDHSGVRLRVEAAQGAFTADAAIVAVPSAVIADEALRFAPALPEKTEAAAGLPLGVADKLFLQLEAAEEFEKDSRLFGRTDRAGTGSYHFRPFGRPMIEAYFGGELAIGLEKGGESAFLDFALGELTGLVGSTFSKRVKPIAATRWKLDPFARGSYSYALPGCVEDRSRLAAPVGDRLFFAGEACSQNAFSTAHGAYLTGIAAAEQAIAARRR